MKYQNAHTTNSIYIQVQRNMQYRLVQFILMLRNINEILNM